MSAPSKALLDGADAAYDREDQDWFNNQTTEYLKLVADQVAGGFLSGHVNATTHWQTEEVYDK